MRDEGRRGPRPAARLHQIDKIDEYLSACQLGITMASLGIGFLGEIAIASLLEDPFGDVVSHAVAAPIAIAIAYILTTTLHITSASRCRRSMRSSTPRGHAPQAPPLEWFRADSRRSSGCSTAPRTRCSLCGVRADSAEFEEVTRSEDLKLLIAQSAVGGKLDPGEAGMLRRLPPARAGGAPGDDADPRGGDRRRVRERRDRAPPLVDSGHTRLVVTEDDSTDRIKGIVHANSLVRLTHDRGPAASIGRDEGRADRAGDEAARRPAGRPSARARVDGRGGGRVRPHRGHRHVEDIIEEVVGEIADETDPAGNGIRRLANGDWWVRGHVPITDLHRLRPRPPIDSEAYNSVGGFVFGELGRLPKRGDMVQANGYSLRVESVRENRIEAVRIRDHHPPRATSERADAGPRAGRVDSPASDRPADSHRAFGHYEDSGRDLIRPTAAHYGEGESGGGQELMTLGEFQ